MFSSLFGHHSDVIFIKTEPLLDVILSVDKSGLVLIHELTELRFLRAFNLNIELTTEDASKLKVCIHHMGYFIFLDHEQTIYVYKYLVYYSVSWENNYWSNKWRSKEEGMKMRTRY
jgi:hypothetical protein